MFLLQNNIGVIFTFSQLYLNAAFHVQLGGGSWVWTLADFSLAHLKILMPF